MVAIIEYGVGNLFSLCCSLNKLGVETQIADTREQLEQADKIILPGVGAFGDAIQKLNASGLGKSLIEQAQRGKPVLGICLGMQLLFEESNEFGAHNGLGLLPGKVVSLKDNLQGENSFLKVPHMGWNQIEYEDDANPLLRYNKNGDWFYYVHSFYVPKTAGVTIASSHYGVDVSGIVGQNNIMGTQFHPEKSGDAGLAFLKAFTEG